MIVHRMQNALPQGIHRLSQILHHRIIPCRRSFQFTTLQTQFIVLIDLTHQIGFGNSGTEWNQRIVILGLQQKLLQIACQFYFCLKLYRLILELVCLLQIKSALAGIHQLVFAPIRSNLAVHISQFLFQYGQTLHHKALCIARHGILVIHNILFIGINQCVQDIRCPLGYFIRNGQLNHTGLLGSFGCRYSGTQCISGSRYRILGYNQFLPDTISGIKRSRFYHNIPHRSLHRFIQGESLLKIQLLPFIEKLFQFHFFIR